jgi:DNA-binding transcriptional regulator PaaX
LTRLCQRGATISELMETLGWQAHSVRGSLSRLGAAGYKIHRERIDGEARYSIEA